MLTLKSETTGRKHISAEEEEERKERKRQYDKEWYEKNKERRLRVGREWYKNNKERMQQYNADNRKRKIFNSARMRAKNKGVPFGFTSHEDMPPIPERCPVFGIPFDLDPGPRTDASPSLDRIIPERGYVPGNVMWISWKANRVKNDATFEELRVVADFYAQFSLPPEQSRRSANGSDAS